MMRKKYSKHHLRAWRRFRNMTQGMLAYQINKTEQTVWRLENGKTGLHQDMLDALAVALQTSRGAILDVDPRKAM